ncbi:uncharacterized protein LOC132201418 [Neocloeon triangulifer]|uniref:uncharacterized protein LOC132201418 n=1 Tax=Neocloeon triangulifer TaxID=2078957 RepID=UPI00286F3852|nr:uncharacterized protein LOC132201418 [Neocloeon triangulifer]XP_059483561.1 uncharacterized protein LOC132201418 [Neocloeon triangulifer]
MRMSDVIFRLLAAAACCFFACGVANPVEPDRLEALCPGHANLSTLKQQNVLTRLGDKFYYISFHDANQGGLEFKLSWKEATEWCQRHAMELVSVDSHTESALLRQEMLRYAENLTSPVPDLYWSSGRWDSGNDLPQVEIGGVVRDRFRWTGSGDWIRDAEIFKATKPGECIVLNTYYVYIKPDGRIKKYARDCERRSSFICELERWNCLD